MIIPNFDNEIIYIRHKSYDFTENISLKIKFINLNIQNAENKFKVKQFDKNIKKVIRAKFDVVFNHKHNKLKIHLFMHFREIDITCAEIL